MTDKLIRDGKVAVIYSPGFGAAALEALIAAYYEENF